MTEHYAQPAQPIENVGRGATFALLAIPAAIIIFAVVGGMLGLVSGFAAIAIPYIAQWLYTKGAGAPLGKAGWAPFVGIASLAVFIGTFVGIIGGFYHSFTRVGGDGGIFGGAFFTTVRNHLTNNIEDTAFPILIGLGLGTAGIVGVLQGRKVKPSNSTRAPFERPAASTAPPAPPAPPVPPAPPTRLAANQSSPGILLNGKPLDPEKR